MYSLFGKIFLWFWITTIATGVVIALTTAQLGGEKIPPMLERAKGNFIEDATRAEEVLRLRGLDDLREWLKRSEHARAMHVFVFDASGAEALGQDVPPPLQRFQRPSEIEEPGILRERPGLMVYGVIAPGGQSYRLVALFRPPHPIWHLFSIQSLVVALLLSALICLGLARYLSAPVRKLRAATQGLAAGDLDIRVGPMLGRRRDEMGGLARDFDRMAERLQALIESQQRLMRDISHELRSPLARLQAALGLARQRTDGRASEELDRIERETERLNELIGQVLSLTRVATDTNNGAREPVDLGYLVRAVAGDADFEAEQNGRRRVVVESRGACVVTGDPALLHSAIENVVRNAVRYTAEGTTVDVSVAGDDARGQAVIRVRDHGPGVEQAILSKIFEPFFRASDARDRASGGYGLGLAIAKRAVELYGGSIEAANAATGGLEVIIRLPLSRAI
jgi:two-component system sensor histidine kinase CpxA